MRSSKNRKCKKKIFKYFVTNIEPQNKNFFSYNKTRNVSTIKLKTQFQNKLKQKKSQTKVIKRPKKKNNKNKQQEVYQHNNNNNNKKQQRT